MNPKLSGDFLVIIDVDFDQFHLAARLGHCAFERWCQLPTWPAPRRPEIDDYGDIAAPYVLVEARIAERYRVSVKDTLATFTALGSRCHSVGRQPVGGIAVRAYNMLQISHGFQCWP